MSRYSISIVGEADTDKDDDSAIAFEREQLKVARDTVARLRAGVTTVRVTDAIFVGDRLGEVNLLDPVTPVGLRVRA